MLDVFCSYYLGAKYLTDGLMAKTDTKYWQAASKVLYCTEADAGFIGGAGTRRQHQVIWREPCYPGAINLVIANHLYPLAQFNKVPSQVVGKRVIVIY